ncbi:MAG: hypothetical protein HAW59_04375 [Betaproteobacteria bacterium]|nr:hypothetical protein [Betaproteobacteria bacterium]
MDINALIRELSDSLGLAETARRDAAAGIPAPDAETPTGAESGAIAAAREEGRKQIAILRKAAQETEDAHAPCGEQRRKARAQRKNADGGAPPATGNVGVAGVARDNAIAAYNQFKNENRLIRDASGDDRLAQFAWAVAIVAAEGAVNSLLFRHAFGGGIAEGFIVAFFIGLVNVGFAFIGGALFLRYAVNHCNPGIKLGGLCGFLMCISVCAATVALASWFRGHVDMARADEDLYAAQIAAKAWAESIQSFRAADIWGLFSSLNGFLLVAVGAICAICGAWKGYEYDDPYPGFGAMLRQKENAEERHQEAQEDHDGRLREWRQNFGGGMRHAKDVLQNSAAALQTSVRGAEKTHADAADLPEKVSLLARGLLAVYRTNNAEIRAAAAPPYFSRYPQGEEFSALEAECASVRQDAEKIIAAAKSLLAECEKELQKLRAALERMQSE